MGSISFTLLACNKKEIKSVMDKNEVIVGLDDAFAPMGFKDESGEIVGFAVGVIVGVLGLYTYNKYFKKVEDTDEPK